MPLEPVSGTIESDVLNKNMSYLDSTKRRVDEEITMSDLSQEVLTGMTGGAVPVVSDDLISRRKLKKESVFYENTGFLETGKQIFNKAIITEGVKINPSNGELVSDSNYLTTDVIPVFENEEAFTLVGKGVGCIFVHLNEKLEFISGGTFNNTDIQQIYSKPKSKYMRFSILRTNKNDLMIARGFLSSLVHEEYHEKLTFEDDRIVKLQEEVANLPEIDLPEGQYASETLYATITNSIGSDYTNDYVKIKVSFSSGEVKNDRSILIKDETGKVFIPQFDPAVNANYKKPSIDGFYKDKSLKNGMLWIKDELPAGASKNYMIEIYPVEVINNIQVMTIDETSTSLVVDAIALACELKKSNKYLLESVILSGVTRTLTNNSSLTYDGAPINFRYNADVVLDNITYDKKGYHFVDIKAKYIYKDEVSLYINYRFFSNGNLEVQQYADITKNTSTSKINQIVQRYLIDSKPFTVDKKDLYSCTWSEGNLKAVTVVQSQGDVPRGTNSDSVPNLPAYTNLVDRSGNHEIMSGWSTTNKTITIPKDCGFLSTIFFNFAGFNDTAQDNNSRVLNQLVSYATKKTIEENKERIIKNIERYATHMMKETKNDTSNSPFDAYTEGKLLLLELGKGSDLDKISQEYKASMKKTYGTITPNSLWELRDGGGVILDVAGRLFPTARIFKKKYEELGNVEEVAYYTNLLTSYAEMLCKSVEKSGWVGILVDVLNSNGCACGSRGLMMGLEIEPDNSRWQNALATNDEVFKSFIRCKNAVVDGQDQDLTNYHYLQYHLFSVYEHTFLRDEYYLDVAEYSAVASNARGQLLDQEYCISSSRRGSPVGNAYIAYLMVKRGNCSDYETANVMLNTLADKMLPTGGAPRILDDWFNPSTSYVNTIAITTSVLLQLLYILEVED